MFDMSGKSFRGQAPPLADRQVQLRDALKRDVMHLAGGIGERHMGRFSELLAAAAYIQERFTAAGLTVESQPFKAEGRDVRNLIVQIPGGDHAGEIVVIGGHYDSIPGSPGANDNASAVAAVVTLAERFAETKPKRTLRFVAFCNEEPPYFYTDAMGSLQYARRCQSNGDNIIAMISFDGLGYFTDEPGTQQYPIPMGGLYPTQGNFIGFVSNLSSRGLLRRAIGTFRQHATIPSQGAALPGRIRGVGFSDHWAFWECGYKAILITDTLPFRYPHYHTSHDTPDKLDYDSMARVVDGVAHVIDDLVNN